MSTFKAVHAELTRVGSPARAKVSAGFFKTGPDQYGAGDKFIGVTVPQQRAIAKRFADLPLNDLHRLLHSSIHEERLTALLILVDQFENADVARQSELVKFYLHQTERINNWDLVDLSAPKILGAWFLQHPSKRKLLVQFASSKNIWERRIAIVATYTFIRVGQLNDTLKITRLLMDDRHDLIHKSCGWMLREVGKKNEKVLLKFLDRRAVHMPRTMLRYAIERISEKQQRYYLKLK